MKKIGEVIRYDTHWETPNGKHAGTIIGYDMGRTKYKVEQHCSFGDRRPMTGVIEWIFVRGKES